MKASLLILGVLHRGNFHPYEIKRRLEAAMVECYTDVDVGTLYYAIRQLEKDGLITAVSQERVARGGVRTVYKITKEGRVEFRSLLHKQFAEDGPVSQTLYGAMLFLHLADLNVIEKVLHARIERLEVSIEKLAPIRKELKDVISTGGEHLLRHLQKQRQLDRDWLKVLLADVKAGEVRDVADPSRLAASQEAGKTKRR